MSFGYDEVSAPEVPRASSAGVGGQRTYHGQIDNAPVSSDQVKVGMNLREQTRRAVRNELAEVALRMFTEHGYDQTTVDQIALTANVSKRSFFRYFATKEEAVTCAFEALGERLTELVVVRPPEEDAWQSAIGAFKEFTDYVSPEDHLARLRLIRSTPSLRLALAGLARVWRTNLAQGLRQRDETLSPLAAEVIAGATHGTWQAAIDEWLPRHEMTSIDDVVDRAFKMLAHMSSSRYVSKAGLGERRSPI